MSYLYKASDAYIYSFLPPRPFSSFSPLPFCRFLKQKRRSEHRLGSSITKSILSCCICSPWWIFRNIASFLLAHRAQPAVESLVAQGSNGSVTETKQPLYSAHRKFNWCLSGFFPFFSGILLRHYNWLSWGDKWQLWMGGGKTVRGNLSTFYLSIERSVSAKKHLKEIFCSYLARTRTHRKI